MIVVCDINEIWRKRPCMALAGKADVLGVAPADWFIARRRGKVKSEGALQVLPVTLPPGWASKTARIGQRLLWKRISKYAKRTGKEIEALVVTSPHYLPMLELVPDGVDVFYYASDDYRSYKGWCSAVESEEQLVKQVDHSFWVSDGLLERAAREYGVDEGRMSVSMNATEDRFFQVSDGLPVSPPEGNYNRPIAGVVGGINSRLDYNLLKRCADLPEIGSLLLVGPLPSSEDHDFKSLLEHPKCVSVGRQPHNMIHQWFQCLDVGLIPYVDTEFNQFCSPMRLFDHLASGSPVVATDVCGQARGFAPDVTVCSDSASFVAAVKWQLVHGRYRESRLSGITWADRAGDLLRVIQETSHV